LKTTGKYAFFRNPKFFKIAKTLSTLSSGEVQKKVNELQLQLQEKIHVGNLLCNLAAGICLHGQYKPGVIKTSYPDQNKFRQTYEDYLRQTKVSLQKILALNDCPKSAKQKETLAERVADGVILGRIPKCPSCNGGSLRFNNQTGEYFCPGFIDGGYFYSDLGDDYIFCNKRFKMNEIQRTDFLLK